MAYVVQELSERLCESYDHDKQVKKEYSAKEWNSFVEYELSVVWEGSHGHNNSWGWSGVEKIILETDEIAYNDESFRKLLVEGAQLLADHLNKNGVKPDG